MGLAADRGVTICFADLDGADGLWVPEERTILVNRALPESRVNEVIEHELAHVAIDDQHAALDAGVFRPPPGPLQTLLAKRWATPALSAAAFVALVGGVTAGLSAALPDGPTNVLPPPSPAAGSPLPVLPEPTTTVIRTVDANGNPTYKTITITPSPPATPVPSATATISPTVPATTQPPPRAPGSSQASRGPTRSATPTPPVETTTPAPVETTTPAPPTETTTPPVAEEPPPAGDAGDASIGATTDPVGGTSVLPGPPTG